MNCVTILLKNIFIPPIQSPELNRNCLNKWFKFYLVKKYNILQSVLNMQTTVS